MNRLVSRGGSHHPTPTRWSLDRPTEAPEVSIGHTQIHVVSLLPLPNPCGPDERKRHKRHYIALVGMLDQIFNAFVLAITGIPLPVFTAGHPGHIAVECKAKT